MDFRVEVDTRDADNMLARIQRRSENFHPVFRRIKKILEAANAANFASSGAFSGTPWDPLDPEYAAQKAAEFGALPILVRTGVLEASLVKLSGPPNHMGTHEATFGTDVEYAKFHQYGTFKMPERKVVFTNEAIVQGIEHEVLDHLLDQSNPRALRNLFR